MTDAWDGQVFRVHYILTRSGVAYHAISDLIFTDHGPLLVLEWDGEIPAVTVQLDLQGLSALPPGAGPDYLYQHPVADPRLWH